MHRIGVTRVWSRLTLMPTGKRSAAGRSLNFRVTGAPRAVNRTRTPGSECTLDPSGVVLLPTVGDS